LINRALLVCLSPHHLLLLLRLAVRLLSLRMSRPRDASPPSREARVPTAPGTPQAGAADDDSGATPTSPGRCGSRGAAPGGASRPKILYVATSFRLSLLNWLTIVRSALLLPRTEADELRRRAAHAFLPLVPHAPALRAGWHICAVRAVCGGGVCAGVHIAAAVGGCVARGGGGGGARGAGHGGGARGGAVAGVRHARRVRVRAAARQARRLHPRLCRVQAAAVVARVAGGPQRDHAQGRPLYRGVARVHGAHAGAQRERAGGVRRRAAWPRSRALNARGWLLFLPPPLRRAPAT